jgi:hypothetical protein
MRICIVCTLVPEFHLDGGPELRNPAFWGNAETFVVLQFSLEYGLRLATSDRVLSFLFDPLNLIDLAAIAPWYLELLGLSGDDSAVLRIFRLARVVRIFKLGKYATGLQLFGRTLGIFNTAEETALAYARARAGLPMPESRRAHL